MSPCGRVALLCGGREPVAAGGGAQAFHFTARLIAFLLAMIACCGVVGWPRLACAQDAVAPDAYAALSNYAHQIGGSELQPTIVAPINDDPAFAALSDYARQIGGAEAQPQDYGQTDAQAGLMALHEFAARLPDGHPPLPAAGQITVADADNAFDALREFLQQHGRPAPAPAGPATPVPMTPLGHPIVPARPEAEQTSPAPGATDVGSQVCLGCHADQIAAFGYTEMGRLLKQGKLQCETCHGPGSVHIHAAGCASCHGDGGITTRPGLPSLVGQDPQYLLAAMKDYITGRRKNSLMKALLSGVSEAELNNLALYYARQPAAPARTPPVGNPSAGKAAIALCAGCHGAQGVSVSPAFPSLAGQDGRYLVDAIRAYRNGSRKKEVACAACHGERGISKTPGIPSLVGQDPQYLVAAMKAYASGQRQNAVMKALLEGVGDAELNNMALYYAQQSPVSAQTPSIGNASVGKTASAVCAACHGAEGVSANPAWPSLAGQDARYLADALEAYKNGSRTDPTMKGIVAALDTRTIDNLASYYAGLSPAQPPSAKGTPAKPAPVLLANRLLASLGDRTINDVASYFASLPPARPDTAKYPPVKYVPVLVRTAAPVGGRSPGGIISFRPNDPSRTAEQNNAICLTCHERGERTMWQGSPHEERGLACTNCHTIMKAVSAQFQLKTPFQPDTCFQCHKDKRAEMMMSAHMPVREGKIVCSDCHNPHGSFTEAMLRTDTINDTCYKCHAEKRGPFLFEHEPVRENCLNCHNPHGSINEHMLKLEPPRLCYECHTVGHSQAGPNSQFTMGRACLNCHTNIHGSNSPAGAVFQR